MTKPNANPLAWLDRIQALADAYPDAEYELAGGLARALPVGELTDDEMALIMAARVPPEHDYVSDTNDKITVANPAGLDLAGAEIDRAPGETDEDFEAAKAMYRRLFQAK